MSISITAGDIALRLALTIIAALLIGYDRGEHGKVAGLRTTLLTCLAASVAMIQVNLLLPMAGKAPDSFVTNDLMRFPLGILTGVGFIGAGAILRRDNLVVGVTTAATLWLVTVIGLCMGGGQIGLGSAATAIGLAALWGLRFFEQHMKHVRNSRLVVAFDQSAVSESELRRRIVIDTIHIKAGRIRMPGTGDSTGEVEFELGEWCDPGDTEMPAHIRALAGMPGIERLEWEMQR